MSRRQKKVNQLVSQIIGGEMSVLGYDFDRKDLDIRRNKISASGELFDMGEIDMIISFDRKVRIKKLSALIDYSDFDGYLGQYWSFSDYQKFDRVSKGSHQAKFEQAARLLGRGMDYLQRAVDLYESLPGVQDLTINYFEKGYGYQTWA